MLAGRNNRAVMDLITQLKSRDMGAADGTNLGPNTVQHFPNGSFIDTFFPALGTYEFAAVLVNTGPPESDNADYTDARYFARQVMIYQASGDSAAALPTIRIMPNGLWLTATNVAEIGNGTHLLPVYSGDTSGALTGSSVTIVTVSMVESVSPGVGNAVYVFNEPTPDTSISFLVTSDFAAGTYWGRYKAKSYAPGSGTATSPGTLAAAEDCIILNGAEWGLASQNNLLLSSNTTTFAQGPVSGIVVGFDAATGLRIVSAYIVFAGCEAVVDPIDGGSP